MKRTPLSFLGFGAVFVASAVAGMTLSVRSQTSFYKHNSLSFNDTVRTIAQEI
ncbi:hypothetical protein QUB59_00900 [Microcoleus sp. A2-D5]